MFVCSTAVWLGSSERLLPLAVEYMYWFLPFLVFSALLSSGMFFVRLDGSPNYAMLCNAIPAVVNILLDYVFIFILKWGMMGAALATSLGYILGAGMIVVYLSRRRNVIHFCRVKLSKKSMRLTWRNVKYMCHLGVSTFLCEAAIACMMFAGNYVFIHYLGEDGVAAFSIACYFFPIISKPFFLVKGFFGFFRGMENFCFESVLGSESFGRGNRQSAQSGHREFV